MELYFSDAEMTDFLVKREYNVEKVRTWDNFTEYHNKVITEDKTVVIAYKDRPSDEFLRQDYYSIKSRMGLERVFQEELHKSLLNIK